LKKAEQKAKILLQRVAFNRVSPVEYHTLFFYKRRIGMKRVKAACICQTLHFMLKEDSPHDWAAKQVKQDIENYKKTLERNRTQYKILEEAIQPDGSVIIKIIKQYNTSPVGDYLD
jgi:hypothetical protein